MVDLSQLLSIEELCIFIIDKHRPFNLDNLFTGVDSHGNVVGGEAQVIVFDDGDLADLQEERAAYFALMDSDDEDEEDEEGYSDDEEAVGRQSPSGTQSETSKKDTDDEHDETDNDNNNSDNDAGDTQDVEDDKENTQATDNDDVTSRKRHRSPTPERQMLKRNKKLCEKLLQEYYSLTYNGTPSSAILYTLSQQLSKESNDFLWMAIIGLSSQHVTEQIDPEEYKFQLEIFKDEVKRFNNTAIMDREFSANISAQHADDFSIHFNPYEMRLMLYRHWSLYEAIFHSAYVASKLKIWREQGKQRLRNLLAKMGFSLVQSQHKYYDCDLDLRKVMEGRLEDVGVRYGLDNLTFESFVRCFGFKTVLGACDAFYSLAALIEVTPGLSETLHLDTTRRDGFYLGFDALDNIDLMLKGIDVAQMLQRAVVRTGIQIIEEKLVKTLKTFRLVVLKESQDLNLFSHPLTLLKLALFMMEAMKQTGRSYMPFVIAALDKNLDSYLTVGVSAGKSTFADAFKRCADVTRASIRQDRFDCSIVEIGRADIGKFMEHLQIFL